MTVNARTNTMWAKIYIAGDYDDARRICKKFCNEIGLCVTVTPTTYIYTGGEEVGVIVELINYPKFPIKMKATLFNTALALADELQDGLYQDSYTVMDSSDTYWQSNREGVSGDQ